jgi:hypothetical protein
MVEALERKIWALEREVSFPENIPKYHLLRAVLFKQNRGVRHEFLYAQFKGWDDVYLTIRADRFAKEPLGFWEQIGRTVRLALSKGSAPAEDRSEVTASKSLEHINVSKTTPYRR